MAGVHSELAPASTSTAGVPPGRGSGVAMQGRTTPGQPAHAQQGRGHGGPRVAGGDHGGGHPSRTSSAARTKEESFLRRTPPAGSSSMAMTSVQATSSRPSVSPTCSGGPTRTILTPCCSAARRAPSTISPGDLSPPMASTATGRVASVSGAGTLAPAAQVSRPRPLGAPCTSHSWGRRRAASWTPGSAGTRCGRAAQTPGPGLVTAALGLGLLLLGDGHRRTPTIVSGAEALSAGAGPGRPATGARRD